VNKFSLQAQKNIKTKGSHQNWLTPLDFLAGPRGLEPLPSGVTGYFVTNNVNNINMLCFKICRYFASKYNLGATICRTLHKSYVTMDEQSQCNCGKNK
jgi:hypothetical protein